jgi:putative transcriptional regulator
MDLNVDFFKLEYNGIVPKQGSILISEPFSQDTFFRRSIVLLTEHNNEGTVGFILNKPVNIPLSDVISDIDDFESFVSVGGPVNSDRIYYIHSLGNVIPNSSKVFGNIYWGGSFDVLKQLIRASAVLPEQVRFFIGYSGWQPKQLAREITNNYWLVSDLEADIIMKNPKNLWEKKLSKMGKKYQTWANFPENPTFN